MKRKFKLGETAYEISSFDVAHASIIGKVFVVSKYTIDKAVKKEYGRCYRIKAKTKNGIMMEEKKLFKSDEVIEKLKEFFK